MILSSTTKLYRVNQGTSRTRLKNALRGLKSGLWAIIFTIDILVLLLFIYSFIDGGHLAIELLWLIT